MKDPRDIIKRPVITEHSADLMADKSTLLKYHQKRTKQKLNMP